MEKYEYKGKIKTVLIDLTRYNEKCGFGEIANNLGVLIKEWDSAINGIRFVALVKKKHKGALGNKISYVTIENMDRDLLKLDCKIDLWHTTDQLFIRRKHTKGMINLLTIHDLNFLHEKKGIHRIKNLLKLKWFVKRSDCITVISEYVKQDLLAHVNLGNKPLHVIYNGINDSTKEAQIQPSFINDDKKFFFTIGQTRKKKNFQALIPMMKHCPDYNLYICGKKFHKYIGELEAIKKQYKADNVYITGEISNEERNWMYAHCQAFLFPSLLEGFGLPVLEAMRYRCKVFSSKCTSLPKICKEHASYFESFNPADMANTIKSELQKWDKHGEHAEAAREYSMKYNYPTYFSQYIALYKQLLEK